MATTDPFSRVRLDGLLRRGASCARSALLEASRSFGQAGAQAVRGCRLAAAYGRVRRTRWNVGRAKRALGEHALATRNGPPDILQRLEELTLPVPRSRQELGRWARTRTQRATLLERLAESVLAESGAEVTDDRIRLIRQAEEDLQRDTLLFHERRASLWPNDFSRRRQTLTGSLLIGAILFVVVPPLLSRATPTSTADAAAVAVNDRSDSSGRINDAPLSERGAPREKFDQDLLSDLDELNRDLAASKLEMARDTLGVRLRSDLERRLEQRREKLDEVFDRWEREERLADVPDGFIEQKHSEAFRTGRERLRERRTQLDREATDWLQQTQTKGDDLLKSARTPEQISQAETVAVPALQTEFQRRLDGHLAVFAREIAAAKTQLLAVTRAAHADIFTPQLTNDVQARLGQLREEARRAAVVWDRNVALDDDGRTTNIYVTKLFRDGHIAGLPANDLFKALEFCLQTKNEFLRKSALEFCDNVDDAVLFARLAKPETLRSADFRQVALGRLPALIRASGENSTRDGLALLEALADAYLAEPQPTQAAALERAIGEIRADDVRQSKQFLWFLASAAWSGSEVAARELHNLYTSQRPGVQGLLYDAASKRKFNYVVGSLVAKRSGKQAAVDFRRCVATLIPAVNDGQASLRNVTALRGHRELSQFIEGWFAAVDPPSFANESLRIYRQVFADSDRKSLQGLECLLGGFETFRLNAIRLTLRTAEESQVAFLYQVDKLYWQSERVVALTTLTELGQLEKVDVDGLTKMVDDPWKGTARYSPGMLTRAAHYIRIDEWLLYTAALEQRSKAAAVAAYKRAVFGQSAVRTSLQGDAAMYPYRIHALRRLLSISPDSFPELVEYAATDKCPGTIRLALLCVYAADHDRIGARHVAVIPTALPKTPYSAVMQNYLEGMLKAFEVIRTGKPATTIRSAGDDGARGYAAVLLNYDDRPDLQRTAVATLAYKGLAKTKLRIDVVVDSEGSDLTPLHFMDRDRLMSLLKQLNPNDDAEVAAAEFAKWGATTWPAPDDYGILKDGEQARKSYVTEHRLQGAPRRPSRLEERIVAFREQSTVEAASALLSDWPLYPPDVLREALKVVSTEKNAIDRVGSFVSSVAHGSPSIERKFEQAPNSCVLLEQRADVLDAIFLDLQKDESGVTDAELRKRFTLQTATPLLKFLENGSAELRKVREASKAR